MSRSRLFTALQHRLKPRYLTLIAAGSVIDQATKKTEMDQDENKESSSSSQFSLQRLKAVGAPISFGLAMGGCAGYATKKATKAAAGLIGVTFVGLQLLQHAGYIEVDWIKMEHDVELALDQNHDGKFDREDIAILRTKYMAILQQSLLSGGGFAVGFYTGFRYG